MEWSNGQVNWKLEICRRQFVQRRQCIVKAFNNQSNNNSSLPDAHLVTTAFDWLTGKAVATVGDTSPMRPTMSSVVNFVDVCVSLFWRPLPSLQCDSIEKQQQQQQHFIHTQ